MILSRKINLVQFYSTHEILIISLLNYSNKNLKASGKLLNKNHTFSNGSYVNPDKSEDYERVER